MPINGRSCNAFGKDLLIKNTYVIRTMVFKISIILVILLFLNKMIFLKNSLIYITFCALLQLLIEVKSQITNNPDLRYAHTATLIDDKIYILGGGIPPRSSVSSPKESFLYLDVSTPFDTSNVNYMDISNNNIVPSHRYAIAIKGGIGNSTLFVYGG